MSKDKLVDYDSTASGNLDVGGVSVAEGMLPSNVNNAIREQMSHLKDFADGTEAINALAVDNLKLDGNTISSTDTNGDITIDPDGTGDTIIASGNVGIGTGSPSAILHTLSSAASSQTGAILSNYNNTAGTAQAIQLDFGLARNSGALKPSAGRISVGRDDDWTSDDAKIDAYMAFSTYQNNALAEHMRLDASGNLLVGGTSLGETGAITMGGDGRIYAIRASDTAGFFGRTSTDGNIVNFTKDGSTVGSIGSEGGDSLFIISGDAGLRFSSGADAIIPITTNGAARDNAIDLGSTGARFKDAYLSGGVYVGGTGSANYLDDYEEGSITATIQDASGNVASTTPSTAFYVKVGKICHININFNNVDTTGLTAGEDLRIYGLPFLADGQCAGSVAASYYTPILNGNWLTPLVQNNVSYIAFFENRTNQSLTGADVSRFNSTYFDLTVQVSYKTD